jgi:hypothetical protein
MNDGDGQFRLSDVQSHGIGTILLIIGSIIFIAGLFWVGNQIIDFMK